MKRAIVHIDMDAFYASVECKDNPALKGKPVVVGGPPNSRSVVSSASYEARKFGIRSAMPSSRAFRLCPDAIFIFPHFERYEAISDQIMSIFKTYTPLVEPLSLDEAYLDVTESPFLKTTATHLAAEIKQKILKETGLTCSAGVAPNKFVAKIASDFRKPNGLTVVKPNEVLNFLGPLPIGKMWGVGKITEKHFHDLNVRTIGELRELPLKTLLEEFGKSGHFFQQLAMGVDDRPVEPDSECKSIGQETTLDEDTLDLNFIHQTLSELSDAVSDRLSSHDTKAHTLTLKMKYHDFKSITRSHTVPAPVQKDSDIFQVIEPLIKKTEAGEKPIRLLGVSASNFPSKEALQLLLFEDLR